MKSFTKDPGEFMPAIAIDQLADARLTAVTVEGKRLIMARVEGQTYAFDRTCPHAAADLMKGSLSRRHICCHEHDYCFDLSSGRIVWPDDEHYQLRFYEVREEEGMVLVKI
ncbi:MAG: Rieske 2Fe-2S domain-containing protein [Chloroflexota bacterium]|jgi:nitrite reductase/ring-hydroxylating ferredoxin subunit